VQQVSLDQVTRDLSALEAKLVVAETARASRSPSPPHSSSSALTPSSPPRPRSEGVRERTSHPPPVEPVALDIESGLEEGGPAAVDGDSDEEGRPRGFRPLTGMALMRRAPARVSAAARVADSATLLAGRLLTGQPGLRLGALGYLLLLHLLLLLAQTSCRRAGLI
jgi:hypothetical protein